MNVSKNTPMSLFEIRAPRWNGGKKVVGLASYRVRQHNKIVITYTRKDGTKSFPDAYYMSGEDIVRYPLEQIPHSQTYCYQVPLADLELLHVS